jgi:hypothetical protein
MWGSISSRFIFVSARRYAGNLRYTDMPQKYPRASTENGAGDSKKMLRIF